MWVLVAPVFWGVSGGEAGETVGTGREWTPGFWECIGCTLARVPKVPEEGISPDPPRRRDSQWGRGRTEGRGRAQPGRQPGPARAPGEEAPAPLPFSRSPLLPWTSALHIRPHLTSRRTSSPLAGWFPILPIYLPWVLGRQSRLNPLTSPAPAPPAPRSLLLFLASLSPILGTVWCPQTPIWLCLCPESRLFPSHSPHPQLGTQLFSSLFQFLTLLPSFSRSSSIFILNSTVPLCPS